MEARRSHVQLRRRTFGECRVAPLRSIWMYRVSRWPWSAIGRHSLAAYKWPTSAAYAAGSQPGARASAATK